MTPTDGSSLSAPWGGKGEWPAHAAPLRRHSIRGHETPLREVQNAEDAVRFVFRYRYWFDYHDEAKRRGIDDPRWIPEGFERVAVKHGAVEAYRVRGWTIYIYATGGVAPTMLSAFLAESPSLSAFQPELPTATVIAQTITIEE